jgi:hypothetical protein
MHEGLTDSSSATRILPLHGRFRLYDIFFQKISTTFSNPDATVSQTVAVAEHQQQKNTRKGAFLLGAPRPGFEPGTNSLTASCSTVELSRNVFVLVISGKCST